MSQTHIRWLTYSMVVHKALGARVGARDGIQRYLQSKDTSSSLQTLQEALVMVRISLMALPMNGEDDPTMISSTDLSISRTTCRMSIQIMPLHWEPAMAVIWLIGFKGMTWGESSRL